MTGEGEHPLEQLSGAAKGAQNPCDGAREATLVESDGERNRKRLPAGVPVMRYQVRQALFDGLFRRRGKVTGSLVEQFLREAHFEPFARELPRT